MAYIGNEPVIGQWRKLDDISGGFNGSETNFTTQVGGANVTAGSANQLLVSLGGVLQEPGTDYSVSSSTITFTTAPAASLSFFAVLAGDALSANTPSDGSVTTAKLGSNLTVDLDLGSAASPSLTFDADSGLFSGGDNQVAVSTSGVERVEFGASEVVFNDGGADYDFRVEGDTNQNLLFLDASSERIGMGTGSPSALLHISRTVNSGDVGLIIQNTGTSLNTASIYLNKGSGAEPDHRIQNDTGGNLTFARGTDESSYTEQMRIDSSGRLLVGTASALTADTNAFIHVAGPTSGNIILANEQTGALGAGGSVGAVRFFSQAGGGGFEEHGRIACLADNTTGSGDKPGRLVFSVTEDGASSVTERIRISANGGTSHFATAAAHGFRATQTAGTDSILFVQNNSSSVTTGSNVFIVRADGDVENATGNYTAFSDQRFKENILDAESQWGDIKSIQIKKFNFKESTGLATHTQIGVIAQELEQVCPNLVKTVLPADSVDDENEAYKTVKLSVLYMKAVKALQEAMERIETLEAEVAALKGA